MIGEALTVSMCLVVLTGGASAAGPALQDKLRFLITAYPETLSHIADGRLHFRDGGSPLSVDDGKSKTHQQKLRAADIEDMLSQIYPVGSCETKPATYFDPGRIRSDRLMRRLYGDSKAEVRSRLVRVNWFGRTLRVTSAHGVDKALRRVLSDLGKLKKSTRRPAKKSAGTFNWRNIAGTKRLSVHSFGAAIDLDTTYADYWRWSGGKPGNVPKYRNRMPLEIVSVFERHGFIWGGRWYHYDFMHFEYRPELIAISKAAGANACN